MIDDLIRGLSNGDDDDLSDDGWARRELMKGLLLNFQSLGCVDWEGDWYDECEPPRRLLHEVAFEVMEQVGWSSDGFLLIAIPEADILPSATERMGITVPIRALQPTVFWVSKDDDDLFTDILCSLAEFSSGVTVIDLEPLV